MKKTKLTRSLLAACSIVALSAVMYGCAHTDSGPSQEELDAANAATAAADEAAAAAATAAADAAADAKAAADAAAADAATAAADAAAVAKAAADEAAADAATAAADAAAAAKTAADAAAAAAATAAADAAAAAKAVADAAAEEAAAALQAAQDEADRLQGAADKAAHDAIVAKLERLRMGLENGETNIGWTDHPTDGTVGTIDDGEDVVSEPMITASHGAPAKVRVNVDHDDMFDTPMIALAPAFAVAEEGMADEIDGFSGTLLMRADTSYSDEMTVYTDVNEPSYIPFGQVYAVQNGSLSFVDTPVAGLGQQGRLLNGNIASEHFVKANTRAHADNADGPDADTLADHVVFPGTYQGAAGVYRCDDADNAGCTSTRGNDAVLSLSAGWTFTPNPDAMVEVVDGVYMNFGWWLRENLNAPANTTGLSVQTFAGSNGADVQVSPAVVGKATFEGAAAGKYALDDPLALLVGGGHFTAAAKLEADFGIRGAVDDAADTAMGTISGMITGGDWSVALLSTELRAGAGATPAADMDFNTAVAATNTSTAAAPGAGTQWTIRDEIQPAAGDWMGWFHNSRPLLPDPQTAGNFVAGSDARNDGTPGYAVGEFSAEFGSIGRMVGAFGTSNVTPDRDPM